MVSPEAGGKNHELVLLAADGARGILDPSFDAHGLPIWMWALAHWEEWLPISALDEAVRYAVSAVLTTDGCARWSVVAGPAAAVVASASRIGWTFEGGHCLVADDGCRFDLRLDPPVVILQAAHRATRRWRLRRVGLLFPHLMPQQPDVMVPADPAGMTQEMVTTTMDFTDMLDGLLQPRRQTACNVSMSGSPSIKVTFARLLRGDSGHKPGSQQYLGGLMTGSANYAILTWARWGTGWYVLPSCLPSDGSRLPLSAFLLLEKLRLRGWSCCAPEVFSC